MLLLETSHISWVGRSRYLLLDKLKLFGFQQLFGDTLWVLLAAEAQGPELLTELSSILVKESGELDLERFDIRLDISALVSELQEALNVQVINIRIEGLPDARNRAQLRRHLRCQGFWKCGLLSTCSASESVSNLGSKLEKLGNIAHFFITSRFTLVISTFLLNSGGNLVRFSSLASTVDAILKRMRRCRKKESCPSATSLELAMTDLREWRYR